MDHFDLDDSGADHHPVSFCDASLESISDDRVTTAIVCGLLAVAIICAVMIAYYGG